MKKRINISIDENTLYYLDGLAYENGVDRSTLITLLVRNYINQRRLNNEDCGYFVNPDYKSAYSHFEE